MTIDHRHVVVFAKAPRLGCVKTRLARDIGRVAAWRFYRQALASLLWRISRDGRWRTHLALTPDRAVRESADPRWPQGLSIRPQGAGDLGARMNRAFKWPLDGAVIIIGADIPDITPAHIASAFARLNDADLVFGPTDDGGYWLTGASATARRATLFKGVRWSSGHELEDSLSGLPPGARAAFCDKLNDVDTVADYRRWLQDRRYPRF